MTAQTEAETMTIIDAIEQAARNDEFSEHQRQSMIAALLYDLSINFVSARDGRKMWVSHPDFATVVIEDCGTMSEVVRREGAAA